ncbi:hypothetical protein [Myroides sp. LoEW2-1]|nr:hypothetical protein [Myroides sp. LoEW2-1]
MYNIFLVDDHPLIVEGYILALCKEGSPFVSSKFTKAFDCLSAKSMIDTAVEKGESFDIAIVDFSVPGNVDFKWNDG